MSEREVISLEHGWQQIQRGIAKVKNLLEGTSDEQFTEDEIMYLYTIIYNMCTQRPPRDYSQQLYDRYKESFQEYINAMVLPALREKHGEFMLRELVKRWENHKVMMKWLGKFFTYLDRYFITRKQLPSLREVGHSCFRELVYEEVKYKVKDTVIALIDREREGEQINRGLLKSVLGIFVEIGMEAYKNDFEAALLQGTSAFYSRKAASWIQEDSYPAYMLKAEECLRSERERVGHYLHASSEPKLLEKVQHELLTQYEQHLLKKEHSGCHVLLRDDEACDG
eukprot:TRINITY_DN966_c0_g1_i9.p1 TRINITY_DN966_c0_g1~~TRINITY_DN966_c0_g1_i9.p1  ORF type:complete len:282 (-),score=66.56 TRINITY_DN966_c0_g1_i9:786-1631(-)